MLCTHSHVYIFCRWIMIDLIIHICISIFYPLEGNGNLEFVPSSLYQSTITESQASISGTPVVTLGFNRPLSESERQTLGILKFGEYEKFSLNNETFVITVNSPLSIGTVTVIVFVRYIDSEGTERKINAIITINIIDDGGKV